ncbi:RNA-binding protein MEX3B [Cimex lectularius]|uniref:RING-type domain-containing protein n=1 Tax=Cimex lectularius TaxID=79782 RepID=A0A8I6RRX1_CIMLE|nr:RNA-binding protein MEX3B [Cimex lectularius]
MPASMFCDLEQNGFEDQRALQLAFELSMLGLSDNSLTTAAAAGPGTAAPEPETPAIGSLPSAFIVPDEARGKKSQNMTECVPVPSSEHVAEIVGRQGCKIKSLRAKTNTYIKTPVRGEEPVFVVTGRKEDVAKAKKEILSAADHFSQIRASRKNNLGGCGGLSPPGPPTNVPGNVTIQVRVPYRVVGLVVGPKGATIKRIQHQTHTYIVTPSRDKEPVFDVTGLPEHVEAARRDIEAHIALRTGTGNINGIIGNGSNSIIMEEGQELLTSLCKTGLGSLFSGNTWNDSLPSQTENRIDFPSAFSAGSSGCSSASSSSSNSGGTNLGDLGSIWSMSLDRDEGIGESPSFESATASSSIWSFPTVTRPSPPNSASPAESLSGGKRECFVCSEREVTAALVPCGHNLFCMECSERLCEATNPTCPVCKIQVCQAIRIRS